MPNEAVLTVLTRAHPSSDLCVGGDPAMERFRSVDYYEVEELFTEQERLVRDTA